MIFGLESGDFYTESELIFYYFLFKFKIGLMMTFGAINCHFLGKQWMETIIAIMFGTINKD